MQTRRVLAAVLATTVAAISVLGFVPLGPVAAAEPVATPWTVTAAPTTGVRDGQTVAINVKTTAPNLVYAAEARVCRSGVDYAVSTGLRPAADFAVGGPNCPLTPISSSADISAVDTRMLGNADTPAGETFSLRVGTGSVTWTGVAGEQSLTCDAENPCSLVIAVRGVLVAGEAPKWVPHVLPITYFNDDAISGCGGADPAILSSVASDRLSQAWINWTLDACGSGLVPLAPTRASFAGEGAGLDAFAAGGVDLAYSALGFTEGTEISTSTSERPSVPVPLALNAVVLAVGNGRPGNNGHKIPYSDIRLTAAEAATIISGGSYGIGPYEEAILARNAELAVTGIFNTSSSFVAGAAAGADSTSWLATNHFDKVSPDAWRVPELSGPFGAEAGLDRGASADLARAVPAFTNALSLYSGLPMLQRNISGFGGTDYGGVWVLTDLGTARALGLTPVAIENANGEFIKPTTETLNAAVPTMTTTDAGHLIPDPHAVSAAGGVRDGDVQPYPLTYVEYAVAPKHPLRNPDCSKRTASQTLLTTWLTYITTTGQDQLPDGLEPLTPELQAAAADAIAKVGATPDTPTGCPDPPDPPPAPRTPPTVAPTSPLPPLAAIPPPAAIPGPVGGPGPIPETTGPSSVRGPGGGVAGLAAEAEDEEEAAEESNAEQEEVALAPVPEAEHSPTSGGAKTGRVMLSMLGLVALGSAAVRFTTGSSEEGSDQAAVLGA